eukprot:SAG11_NODE_770_length_7257_cov_2.448449_2_plen_92_part_00
MEAKRWAVGLLAIGLLYVLPQCNWLPSGDFLCGEDPSILCSEEWDAQDTNSSVKKFAAAAAKAVRGRDSLSLRCLIHKLDKVRLWRECYSC